MSEKRAHKVLDLIQLETVEENLFRGANEERGHRRLFGGQVLAQALAAACSTVDSDCHCHSLHGYFLRPGDAAMPVVYQVDRIRNGRSFTTRRVLGIQKGEAIFSLDVSFHVDEPGLAHASPMPDVPAPDDLPEEGAREEGDGDERSQTWWSKSRPAIGADARRKTAATSTQPGGLNAVWLKYKTPVPDDRAVHNQLLAYASDMSFVSTAVMPHARVIKRRAAQIASLDHAMWFHQPFRVDDWLLIDQEPVATAGGRGLSLGRVWDRSGRLVATMAQEAVIRLD